MLLTILPVIFDPLFTRLFKLEQIYTNYDCTKFSIQKIITYTKTDEKEEYFTYLEGIEHKFPGYTLDENFIVKNVSDISVDLKEQLKLFMSKNMADYDLAI